MCEAKQKISIKKTPKTFTKEQLEELSKDELIERLLGVLAHNEQLKNIISKTNNNDKKTAINHQNYGKSKKPFDHSKYAYRHVLLKFFYLGWDYHGYVVQEDTTNTIEHHLFEALHKTHLIKSREESNYHRCGRTDKGVSSFSQVISIDLRSKLSKDNQENTSDEYDYCQMLNRVLPDTIQCVAWCPVEEEYSARFNCNSRTYKYFFPKGSLNIMAMQKAGDYLLGSHDFRNLCKMDVANGVTEFTRTIDSLLIQKAEEEADPQKIDTMYFLVIQSKGFLWHQIRCIMGVLFLIGEEKEKPEIIQDLLDVERSPRKPDYNMASEIPLNLFHCNYDVDNNFIYNLPTLKAVMRKLHGLWTVTAVKSTMIKAMLSELEQTQSCQQYLQNSELSDTNSSQTEVNGKSYVNILHNDNKRKTYIPLMLRPKCDSLEEKIEHYLKRRRIEVKESSD